MVSVMCSGQPAVAVIDQVRAIAKERLTALVGRLAPKELDSVEASLREILELD
jgi:mRNA-degrading endonuclease toxin of MazEF toxin-antitoxin module